MIKFFEQGRSQRLLLIGFSIEKLDNRVLMYNIAANYDISRSEDIAGLKITAYTTINNSPLPALGNHLLKPGNF
ncbi:MAG: hypothetical protein U9P10_02085 [Thermodesulfobacteriota bacterium]|nr:hypothetical protein [Thermodesulfobacteriota bacterium]